MFLGRTICAFEDLNFCLQEIMCGGPEHLKPASPRTKGKESNTNMADSHSNKVKEISESCSNLHELAANNDLIGFKKAMEEDGSKVDEVNFWYCRQNGSNQMVLEQRTPLMVASLYGSIDVLNYILSIYVTCGADVNQACGSDKSTALHCAAGGGSIYAVEAVRLLIQSGGDINCVDAYGRRPAGVVMVSPRLTQVKANLEEMLNSAGMYASSPMLVPNRLVGPHGGDSNGTEPMSQSNLMSISTHPGTSSPSSGSPQSATSSPKFMEATKMFADGNEKKEYPIDPSLPDIKNSIYTTDEFRMFSFKVRPCSRAYSHDWTECPFVHPGEMLEGVTQEGTIIAVFLAQILGRGLAGVGICVNMHMVFLSAGCTLPNIVQGCAKMGQVVHAEYVSLLTHLRNFAPYLFLLVQQFHPQGHHHL